ncbi:MAG: division/cell wall cluster transcriptional repressor MraZ [Prolixibacteraceae bacterium]
MPDFSNTYNASIDDKGRVVLPAAFKREMGDSFDRMFTVEIDPYEKCFNIYPSVSWDKRLTFIRSRLNPNDPRQSRLLDKFYQNFVKIGVSDNGRLNIPNAFLEKMGITKEVVFTGQGDRIRLWEAEAYRKAMMPDEEYPATFEEFLGGGLNSY